MRRAYILLLNSDGLEPFIRRARPLVRTVEPVDAVFYPGELTARGLAYRKRLLWSIGGLILGFFLRGSGAGNALLHSHTSF